MRWCLSLVLAAGCGRFGFSDRTGGDAHVDSQVGDTPATDAGICHSGTWGTPTALTSLNTASEEADPSIRPDELELFFDSNRVGGQARAIWHTTRASRADAFGAPVLVAAVDSASDDTDAEISPDGLTLYFRSNRTGSNDIFVATRPTSVDPFVLQGALPFTDTGSTVRSGPDVTGDDLTMFFTRNDLDVAVATRPDTASTFAFVREIDEVNAPSSDGNPSVTPDGLELFFDSYRTGAAAVFTASRASTADTFSAPTEMPELLGSGSAAGTPEISSDGRTLYYFVSLGGELDLYTATRTCP